jgi:hypothetical protein
VDSSKLANLGNVSLSDVLGLRHPSQLGEILQVAVCPTIARVKRIHGHLSKFRHAVMRFRTEEPDHSDLPDHCVLGRRSAAFPEQSSAALVAPVKRSTTAVHRHNCGDRRVKGETKHDRCVVMNRVGWRWRRLQGSGHWSHVRQNPREDQNETGRKCAEEEVRGHNLL